MARAALILLAAAATAVIGAAPVAADPDNLLPWCSGDQTPMDNNCKVAPSQVFTHDHGTGANPQVPVGLDPEQQPVVGTSDTE